MGEALTVLDVKGEEAPTRTLPRALARLASLLSGALALYALFWTQVSLTTQVYRATFLLGTLVLVFLLFPMRKGEKAATGRSLALDALWIIAAGASLGYLVMNFEEALHRVTSPTDAELVLGGLLLAAVLEATRRTTGWALPLTAAAMLAYAYFGAHVPEPFDHRGYGFPRIIGQNYLTLEGVFGVPLDVAATFVVLFTVYGAVLEASGAGKFFLDWSFALMGRAGARGDIAAGRSVTVAGFLLGTVSGSGVATTVTLGALAWPILKRAGYEKETAGGVLAAGGIGAMLSPPTLGAAAFLIAEYLKVTYLDVLVMASVPTVLYYLSCFLMVGAKQTSLAAPPRVKENTPSLWELTRKHGYHFSSLIVVAALMVSGMTVFAAVFWALVLAMGLSLLDREAHLGAWPAWGVGLVVTGLFYVFDEPRQLGFATFAGLIAMIVTALVRRAPEDRRLLDALASGGRGVLSVATTTATAGIIVSIMTLTGLGLKLSGLIVDLAGGAPLPTVLLAAVAVMALGLAVPVTASYVIAAVMIVPAMTATGIPEFAAHMFVFYYAVLSDVSPPTALSPYAAAAITGGDPFKTMVAAWRFCLPAFVVPIIFTARPDGAALLLKGGTPTEMAIVIALVLVGIASLAIGLRTGHGKRLGRVLCILGGLLLFLPQTASAAAGLAAAALGVWLLRR